MKRKFAKEFLQEDVLWEGNKDVKIIKNEIYDTRRWSQDYELIFQYEGSFYQTCYSRGATEQQDEQPFEYEGDEIECTEVEPFETIVIDYREKK